MFKRELPGLAPAAVENFRIFARAQSHIAAACARRNSW